MQVKREHLAGLELAVKEITKFAYDADKIESAAVAQYVLLPLIEQAKAAVPTSLDPDLVELLETVVPALHNLSERSLGVEYFILAERVLTKLAELQK